MLALSLRPGDEVICPSLSFIATANCIVHAGGTPVFVDIEPSTYNIDPTRIEGAITPSTRAIMAVHQVGLPCALNEILAIAEKHNLAVIEDAAPAIGAETVVQVCHPPVTGIVAVPIRVPVTLSMWNSSVPPLPALAVLRFTLLTPGPKFTLL